MKAKSRFSALILAVFMLMSISVFQLSASAENVQISMNTKDIDTIADTNALGYSGDVKSLGYGESITFSLTVPASEASYYQVRLHGSTTGQSVYVIIRNAEGTEVFSKFHQMNYLSENVSGHPADQIDGSDGVVKLDAGIYSVLIMNGTENTSYGFKSLEFRDVMLPLGLQKTAFKATDAYYYAILQYHYSAFQKPNTPPEDVIHVGGENYYHLLMDGTNAQIKPDLRYYIVAEEAGLYELSIRSYGRGGIKLSVNGATATEILPFTDATYEWRTDVCTQKIMLNKGLNDLHFSGGGKGGNALTGMDCFMLEAEESKIPLNQEDTFTKITPSDIGYTGNSVVLAKNESLSFRIRVSEDVASKYITHLTSGATGATVSLSVTDANDITIFDKSMKIARVKCLYSGAAYQGKDGEGAVMDLSAGTYTVTLTNTSDINYTFKELEFRNVIMPLGDERTAFHSYDAYHQDVMFWHATAFSWYGNGPEGAVCVGGSNNFTSMLMQQTEKPILKYWVYAQNAGEYKMFLREIGFGGIKASVNGGAAVTFSPLSTTNISQATAPASNNISHYVITQASSNIHLNKGLNIIEISGGCAAGSNYSLFTDFQLERVINAIALNNEDTCTQITAETLGSSAGTISIKKNENISFDIRVPDTAQGTYLARISGTTTGQIINLSVVDSNGTAVYNKSQDMTRATDDFTGVSGTGIDYDGSNISLTPGVYTITLTNLSDTAYGLKTIEFRNLMLPLGTERTAFKVTDAYYRRLNHWHCTAYTNPTNAPTDAKHVGGEAYYLVIMQEHSLISPELRFYINAETAGEYILKLHTQGHGGIQISVNGSTSPISAGAYTTDEYDWRMDTVPSIVMLNKGLNTISLLNGSLASVNSSHYTKIDYFTLEPLQAVWPAENALCATITENAAHLSWNPENTENVSAWEIYQNDMLYTSVDQSVTFCTISGLLAETQYEFKVKAVMTGMASDAERTIIVRTKNFPARENIFTHLSAGKTHIAGINKNGKLQTFGSNNFGQACKALTSDVSFVSAGATTSYAIDTNGIAYAWGNNAYGQAGISSEDITVSIPAKITSPTNIMQISGGTSHALALTSKGEVYAWGDNRYGQLGIGDTVSVLQSNEPILVTALSGKSVTKVYAGPDISFAICADGSLYGWGINYMGQLGNGDNAFNPQNTPVQITLPGKVWQVVSGSGHTAFLCYSDTNGNNLPDADEKTSVYVCGADNRGQLATGDLGARNNTPTLLTDLQNTSVVSLAAGDAHTLALTRNGSVYAWGWNEDGQLGIGTQKNSLKPVLIAGLPKVTAIDAGYAFSVALAEDDSVYAWGANSAKQIADSDTPCYTVPVSTNFTLENISIGNVVLDNGMLSATCYNNMDKSYTGVIRICVYTEEDGKPKLTTVIPQNITLEMKEEKEISVPLTLAENEGKTFVKIFAWDTNVTPYAKVAVIR